MTVNALKSSIMERLEPIVGQREASAMQRVIMEDVARISAIDSIISPEREIEAEICGQVMRVVDRVVAGEPLQYVLGKAGFNGFMLSVEPGVLIPRPETSMLVDIICDTINEAKYKKDMRILDVGTGSGAIAIALAAKFPSADIDAIDKSDVAVRVTETNCHNLKINNVHVALCDVLHTGLPDKVYDIIVSNPPYVLESEREGMDDRVLNYEPAQALFVSDNDPLVFYRLIIQESKTKLSAGGMLFFEINPRCATDLKELAKREGNFDEIDILRYIDRRERFMICKKYNR